MNKRHIILLAAAGLLLSACASFDEPKVSRPGVAQPDIKPIPSSQSPDRKETGKPDPKTLNAKQTTPEKPVEKTVKDTVRKSPPVPVTDTPAPEPKPPEPSASAKSSATVSTLSKPKKTPPAVKTKNSASLYALEGQVALSADDVSLTDDAVSKTIIYYVPDQAFTPKPPGRYRIATKNKRFIPEVLVIPVGSTVRFPNKDVILHNVFSVAPISTFDLGFYGQGKAKSYTFKTAGLSVIYCNVHYAMQSSVLVLETPYFTQVAQDGSFRLNDIPAGSGTLHIWHPRADETRQTVTVPKAGGLDVSLVLTKPFVPKHLNKTGDSYRPTRR